MKGGTWSFDKSLLLFEDLKGGNGLDSLDFRYAPFWVHFHKLPMACFYRKYAITLANSIGSFDYVDLSDCGSPKGETLRVRVITDIKKPLRRGTNVKVDSMGEEIWSPITYEKLPDFCYQCGLIGHV